MAVSFVVSIGRKGIIPHLLPALTGHKWFFSLQDYRFRTKTTCWLSLENVMNCDRCNRKNATIHLTEIIKDSRSELHLCEECARAIGLNSKLSSFNVSVSDIVSYMDEPDDTSTGVAMCDFCGTTFDDYKRTGLLGCPRCYEKMETQLRPFLAHFHATPVHVGRRPSRSVDDDVRSEAPPSVPEHIPLGKLRRMLDQAVEEERYEDAARLRDLINMTVKR